MWRYRFQCHEHDYQYDGPLDEFVPCPKCEPEPNAVYMYNRRESVAADVPEPVEGGE